MTILVEKYVLPRLKDKRAKFFVPKKFLCISFSLISFTMSNFSFKAGIPIFCVGFTRDDHLILGGGGGSGRSGVQNKIVREENTRVHEFCRVGQTNAKKKKNLNGGKSGAVLQEDFYGLSINSCIFVFRPFTKSTLLQKD